MLDIGTVHGRRRPARPRLVAARRAVGAGRRELARVPGRASDVDYRAVPPRPCGAAAPVRLQAVAAASTVLVLFVPARPRWLLLLLARAHPGAPAADRAGAPSALRPGFYLERARLVRCCSSAASSSGPAFRRHGPAPAQPRLVPDRVYPLYGFRYCLQRIDRADDQLRVLHGPLRRQLVRSCTTCAARIPTCRRVEQTGSNFGVALKHETPYLCTSAAGTMVSDGLSIINAEFSSTSFRLRRPRSGAQLLRQQRSSTRPAPGRATTACSRTKVMVPIDGEVRRGRRAARLPAVRDPAVGRSATARSTTCRTGERAAAATARARTGTTRARSALFLRRALDLPLRRTLLLGSRPSTSTCRTGSGSLPAAARRGAACSPWLTSWWSSGRRVGFRRLQPQFCSIYEPYFWWHERFWKLSAVSYLAMFNGTPFKGVMWRLLGVRIGRRVFDDGCAIPEKTLVEHRRRLHAERRRAPSSATRWRTAPSSPTAS